MTGELIFARLALVWVLAAASVQAADTVAWSARRVGRPERVLGGAVADLPRATFGFGFRAALRQLRAQRRAGAILPGRYAITVRVAGRTRERVIRLR